MAPRDAEPLAGPASSGAPAPTGAREALRQIQQSAQALLAQGQVEETWEFFLSALEAVLVKNRELELLVAKLRRERRGPSSERMDPAQLSRLLEALGAQEGPAAAIDPEAEARADAALEAEIERAEQAQPARQRTTRQAGPGWQTRGVQRHVHHTEVPDAERRCADCGRATPKIGEDVTRGLEYVPAHFIEHEYHRDTYAGGRCKEGVTTAPGPAKVLARSAVDASLLAHLVVSKFADHRVPRMRTRDAERQKGEQCCRGDEGRPLGVGVQDQAPNHLTLRWSRARVVNGGGNGAHERIRCGSGRRTRVNR